MMQKALFWGILVGALALGGVIAFLATSTPNTTPEKTTSSFNTPFNVFELLTKREPSENAETIPTSILEAPKETDREALQELARAWNERRVLLEKQHLPQNIAPSAPAPVEPKDIFASLLGPKITDALNAPSQLPRQNTVSFDGESALWGEGTAGAQYAPVIPQAEKTYAIQDELKVYANTLAQALNTFISAEGDQSALLSAYLEARTDTVAQARLRGLTNAYQNLAEKLATIEAPLPLAQNHQNLSTGYERIGTYLWDITTAQTDGELYNKLIAYNAVAEDVARYHIVVITSLKAYGVTFAPGEPGNAFVFDGAKGTSDLSL